MTPGEVRACYRLYAAHNKSREICTFAGTIPAMNNAGHPGDVPRCIGTFLNNSLSRAQAGLYLLLMLSTAPPSAREFYRSGAVEALRFEGAKASSHIKATMIDVAI